METGFTDPQSARATFNEQGYIIANGIAPRQVTGQVLKDLHLAVAQVADLRGLSIDAGSDDNSLLNNLKRVLEADVDLYLNILRMGSRLQSVYSLTMHQRILDALADLGRKVFTLPCGVALHVVARELKIPGGYFGWVPHQDWASSQGSLDQCVLWIPLMDVGKEFYPLELIPGSHKRGVLPGNREGADPRGALIGIDPECVDEGDFISVEANRGDVVIMSGLTVHRTGFGSRDGIRIACGTRFDNLQDPTFVERGYPCAFRLHAETELLHPGFPTRDQVRQLFDSSE